MIKLKEMPRRTKEKVLFWWDSFPEEKQKSILESVSSISNFLVNAILLAIPVSLLFFNPFTIKSYFLMVLCLWILMPFVENYYVWFRERWKDELLKK